MSNQTAVQHDVRVRLSRHRTLGDCVVQIDVRIEHAEREPFKTTAVVEVARPASVRILDVTFEPWLPGYVDGNELRELVLLFREAVILSRNPRMDTTFHYSDDGLCRWTFVRQEEHA